MHDEEGRPTLGVLRGAILKNLQWTLLLSVEGKMSSSTIFRCSPEKAKMKRDKQQRWMGLCKGKDGFNQPTSKNIILGHHQNNISKFVIFDQLVNILKPNNYFLNVENI